MIAHELFVGAYVSEGSTDDVRTLVEHRMRRTVVGPDLGKRINRTEPEKTKARRTSHETA